MEESLEPWKKYKDIEPPLGSIPSMTVLAKNLSTQLDDAKSTSDTNFLLIKHTSVSHLPFLRHYFIQIGQVVWHPGAADRYNGFRPINEDEEKSIVEELRELCNFCTYHYLEKCLNKNTRFFLPTNNCEIIVGKYEETIVIYIFLVLLGFIYFHGFLLFPVIGLITIILILLLFTREPQIIYLRCPHIQLWSGR